MANVTNFSNTSNNNLPVIIVCSILLSIIVICAILYVILKVKKFKHKTKLSQSEQDCLNNLEQENSSGELYKNAILDKEIAKYKELRSQYKAKLIGEIDVSQQEKLNDYKVILDEELLEYKNEQILKITKEIESKKEQILKDVLLNTMQPMHLKVLNETSVSYLPISEEIKSRIVGKKGQNIKHLNEVTNCNMNLDKTSKYLEISCPNPYDRAIAINTVKHLIKSEAFDLKAIENVYIKERRKIEKECSEIGKEYLNKLDIQVPNPNIYSYVGRLRYRWSFSQNILEHCYETALICEKLAKYFGLNPNVAKKVGFFHDIGKAVDYEKRYDHVGSGVKIAKECDLDQITINAILKHHRSNCYEDYVLLVRTADAWSAARIGARHTPTIKDEHTIQLIEDKINKIKNVQSAKVEIDDNVLRITFLPIINNKSTYNTIKFDIIRSLKKDVRFNKFKIKFIDETI